MKTTNLDRLFRPTDEVADALNRSVPVVALESTIITHGMPWPRNLETAQAVEAVIRTAGAIPATIALLDGTVRIGLEPASLERLAQSNNAVKVSRRDMGVVLAKQLTGATTVAATMIAAHRAGIKVFATGGIGGVHRGWQETLDISADLMELGRTPVAVVCAGAKSILDLPRTMEVLETQGVPVLGYGTDELPAFHIRKSGISLDLRVDNAAEAAEALGAHWGLGLESGVIVANPIPQHAELDKGLIDEAVEMALGEAARNGIAGKDVTPYLLERLEALTDGKSLEANIALVLNNAKVAAEIAVALASRATN